MRHHFGDSLDREGGYWTVIPNRERYAYRIGDVPAGSPEITIVTIGKADQNWARALTLPNLEELTLHEPTPEQLSAIATLRSLKRLRITHARPANLDFIASMSAIEELVLEYVSGFCDMSPVGKLKRLRALHLENLRRVSDFGGLSGANNLKCLSIHGTMDWQQPIDDFEFIHGLPRLEALDLWLFICRARYPAALPLVSARKLKKLSLVGDYLATEEYALLEEGLKGVEGAFWGPYRVWTHRLVKIPKNDLRAHLPDDVIRARHPEITIDDDGSRKMKDPKTAWFEFTGRAAGRVKATSSTAEARRREKSERYEAMKKRARALINKKKAK